MEKPLKSDDNALKSDGAIGGAGSGAARTMGAGFGAGEGGGDGFGRAAISGLDR